jgi:hypothetical protein
MRRASYRNAVDFIAQNDEAGIGDDAYDPERVAELVTSILVADIFGVEAERVGRDVVRRREQLDKFERSEAAYDAEIAAEDSRED